MEVMPSRLKIVAGAVILMAVFFGIKFLFFGSSQPEICPPDQCQFSKKAKPPLTQEPGRIRQDFLPNPPDLPTGLPVDKNPIAITQSYTETMEGDKAEQELRHIQTTYAYVTQKDGAKIASEFENYFRGLDFDVTKNKDKNIPLYTVQAEKGTDVLANVTIATRNQFQRLVTVSLISVERLQEK